MGEPVIPPVTCPVLIGRENQLATLRQLVENAARGETRLALIGGEAGVGKSRLVAGVKAYVQVAMLSRISVFLTRFLRIYHDALPACSGYNEVSEAMLTSRKRRRQWQAN